MTSNLKVTVFKHSGDNVPASVEIPWQVLVQTLAQVRPTACTVATCKRSECEHKDGASWSPISYKPGTTRAKRNVEAVYAMVIDKDHLPDAEFVPYVQKFDTYCATISSSHSDRPGDRCIRVVLATSRPVTPEEFARLWKVVGRAAGADEQTKDASRIFYAPSRPHDACHPAIDGSGYFFHAHDGIPLDVDAILATVPPEPVAEETPFEIPEFAGAPSFEARAQAAQLLGEAWPSQGRHQVQLALAGALSRAGWPAELTAEFCGAVAEVQEPGSAKLHKRLKAAQDSISKIESGYAVNGWPTVCEHVDPEVVDQVTELLGMCNAPPEDDPDFVQAMTALIPVPPPPPKPDGLDVKADLKEWQKKLAGRKDAEALKQAELLKRVNAGDFLTDDADDNRLNALCEASLVVARAVRPGTTQDQIVRVLLASAGALASELPEIVTRAQEIAKTLPPLDAKKARAAQAKYEVQHVSPDDQFDIDTQGPRQGRPTNGSQKNLRIALMKTGVQLHYNEFCEQEEMVRDGKRVVIEDIHLKTLRAEMERAFDFKPSKDDLWDLTEVIAHESKYHPVRDYLDRLPRDIPITDLTETWLIRFAGAPDTPYVRAVSRLTLVAAVRRIRQPGCVFQEMLILETPQQGKYKSTGLKALAVNDEWFSDDLELDDDDKKMIEQTSGKWIIEAPELSGMSKQSHNKMKKWLSKTSGRSRMAYGRKVREFLRQFIVIGTTNDVQYLKDQTGNRRYWPIRIVEFDVKALVEHRDQLWAEAARLDLENPEPEYIRLDPSLYEAAAEEQARRQVDDPLVIILEGLFGQQTGRVRMEDVWKVLGHHAENRPNRTESQEISVAMLKLGWEKERLQVGGVRDYYYERGTDEQKKIVVTVDGTSVTGWRIKPLALPAPKPLPPPSENATN